ncbi:NUDIX domain-containing protein [Streptomyces sp. NPDC057620]|uniref:NUDIX domain-containing protein n=1 Tax=Streptomyces sp. NPDC057620 TaxID=3346185 RepID=UPI0036AEC5A1
MIPIRQQPTVDLLDVRELRLIEVPRPPLPPEHQTARDTLWDKAAQANPALFDGPIVACPRLERTSPHEITLHWTRATYRDYALRWVPEAATLPSLFVDVLQPTDDGALLIARMSPATAAPGRWQLPGGSVEQPGPGNTLDTAGLRDNAARELVEETGVDTDPDDLTLWALTRGTNGNIGVHFMAPARPLAHLNKHFTAVVTAAEAAGQKPELDQITPVRTPADLANLTGPHVDYLEPVVDQYARILRLR